MNNNGGNGKNVPLDLEVEHDNNSIKEGIRKLGPNLTCTAVTRCARMLPAAEEQCKVCKGMHFDEEIRKVLRENYAQ